MKYQKKYQNTLNYALLIYMSIIVLLITLIPFDFRMTEQFKITWSTNLTDLITNIFLFIPIGFFFKLSRGHSRDALCLAPLLFGLILSTAIEFTQSFIPGRYTQVIDVAANGLGAWLGGIFLVYLKGQLNWKHGGRLPALDLPLMSLIYLLVPLIWLSGLATGKEANRLWVVFLLGLFGASVLSSTYNHRLKKIPAFSRFKLSLVAMGWFYISTLTVMVYFPVRVIGFGVIVGVMVQIIGRLSKTTGKDEQRFELPTLKRLLPLYIIYLLIIAMWPTTLSHGEWQLNTHFEELAFNERIILTFRFVEYIAAFTLFGYMIAEMRGRKDESAGKTLGWIFFLTLGSSILIEILSGFPELIISNILAIGTVVAAGLYGGVIYILQLAAIRRL